MVEIQIDEDDDAVGRWKSKSMKIEDDGGFKIDLLRIDRLYLLGLGFGCQSFNSVSFIFFVSSVHLSCRWFSCIQARVMLGGGSKGSDVMCVCV